MGGNDFYFQNIIRNRTFARLQKILEQLHSGIHLVLLLRRALLIQMSLHEKPDFLFPNVLHHTGI